MQSDTWSPPTRILGCSVPSFGLALRIVFRGIAWGALAGGAGLLLVRRATGAFATPLTTAAFLAAGMGLVLLGGAARGMLPRSWSHAPHPAGRWLSRGLGGFCAAVAAWGVSLPGSPLAGVALLWMLVGALLAASLSGNPAWEVLLLPFQVNRTPRRGRQHSSAARSAVRPLSPRQARDTARSSEESPPTVGTKKHVAGQTQSLVRSIMNGEEIIAGELRGVLAAGSRALNLHVGFTPPFAVTPEVEWDIRPAVSGVTATAVQVLPHGARFEIKVAAPAQQALTLEVVFRARAASQRDD